jgi:hypothetical protein
MAANGFSFSSFIVRFVVALTLVFATYNPTGTSWYHWFTQAQNKIDPLIALAAILLLIGWVIYIRATVRSLGMLGTLLAAALFGTIIWAAIDNQLLSLDNATAMAYVVLIALSAVMAAGLSWSHIRRRMTGQLDVDDRDD